MLQGYNVARLRLELAADLATPRPIFEGLVRPRCLLHWRNVLPGLVVAGTVSPMQRIEDAQLRLPRRIKYLHHMRHTIICFSNSLQAIPYFPALGNEVVIWID